MPKDDVRTDDRGERAPRKAADGRAPAKSASKPAPTKPAPAKAVGKPTPAKAANMAAPSRAASKPAPTKATSESAPARAASKSTPQQAVSKTAPTKDVSKAPPKQAPSAGVPKKVPSAHAPKKVPSAHAPKKPANDLSLERVLESRAAMEALAGRSLESLVDEFAPKDRSLNNIDAIVAPRTTDPTVNLVKGARVRQCALCNEDIWVAPSSFAAFKGRVMPPLWCAECAMTYAELNSPLRRRPAGRA
jgi:hypothetical protein